MYKPTFIHKHRENVYAVDFFFILYLFRSQPRLFLLDGFFLVEFVVASLFVFVVVMQSQQTILAKDCRIWITEM